MSGGRILACAVVIRSDPGLWWYDHTSIPVVCFIASRATGNWLFKFDDGIIMKYQNKVFLVAAFEVRPFKLIRKTNGKT